MEHKIKICAIAMLLIWHAAGVQAQKITRSFRNTSLSEALIAIDKANRQYNINFIYNELEDFVVTADIRNLSVPDAVCQVVGFYPMRITVGDSIISVECMQKEAAKLTGRLIDENGKPVEYANISLLSVADSSLITGGVSNADGRFVIPCGEESVIAKVTFVGYKTVYRRAAVGDMGTIRMRPDATVLGSVVVKGRQPEFKMVAGGMDIRVQNTVLGNVGTANDVLSMLPRVSGSDGNFTVFAKGTPEIYINNRKVQDKNELQQLKSQDIRSVEVITSPGARYNAEVNAVIRIKTVKPQGDGLSVSAFSQVKRNNKWQNYDDVNIKYRSRGLEVFGMLSFSNSNHSEDDIIEEEILGKADNIKIGQVSPLSFWFSHLNGKTGLSYDFDSDNSVGLSYDVTNSLYQSGWMHGSESIMRNGMTESVIQQVMRSSHDEGPSHNANIYYVGRLGKMGIDFNGSCVWKKSGRHDNIWETSEELGDKISLSDSRHKQRLIAGKLVFDYPVWKGSLNVGSEITHTSTRGIYTNENQDVKASDDEIRESNVAGFADYEVSLGAWSIGGGLRFEHVTSDYESYGVWQEEPSRRYNDFFPNLSVAWQKDKLGIELSYNKRTQRPSYYQLNSFIQYDNRYTYEGGNPLLRPSKQHNISLSAVYAWLNAELGYEYNKDKSLSFVSLYNGQDIILWTDLNFNKFEVFHASVVAAPKFGFYHPTFELTYWQQYFHPELSGFDKTFDKPEFSIKLRNWFTVGKTCSAMLYLYYATSHDYGFKREARKFAANARIQKTFMHDAFTLSVFADDIFRTLRDKWYTSFPDARMSKDAYTHSQVLGISLNYQFNSTRSKYKGTGAGNAEKSRL